MSRIVVDLAPVLPGGENGGAKIVVSELLRKLAEIAPQHDFILLTVAANHDELSFLDAANVSRCQFRTTRLLKEIKADLFFCPFTTVSYFEPNIPVVSLVHDIQCYYYPFFFSHEDELYRKKSFIEACRLASRLVCVSNYVRQTILENAQISPQHVITNYIRLSKRLKNFSLNKNILTFFGLHNTEFLLYPANFWPHKNHATLINAFSLYQTRNPSSKLKLVFTGTPGKNMDVLKSNVIDLKLENKIFFLNFLSDEQFANIMQACRALIFPSLYEGFGMPILEAMAFGKPVLCSNVTSLPEVAGDAAIMFDPQNPTDIAEAIEKLEKNDNTVSELINRGYKRLDYFGDTKKMAEEYLNIFADLIKNPQSKYVRKLQGIYEDGWATDRVLITYESHSNQRQMELKLSLPELDLQEVNVKVINQENTNVNQYVIKPKETITIPSPLNEQGGTIELMFEPTFQLSAEDTRQVGCYFHECQIVFQNGESELTSIV
jgi:glycosyltransferase involved in cell wall biosynthesis